MEELLVSSVCKVVDDSHLRGIELDHQLGWDRWYKTTAHGERCQVDILCVWVNERHL